MMIIKAIVAGDMDQVKDLIQQGTDVNVARTNGKTALMFAVDTDNLELGNLLDQKLKSSSARFSSPQKECCTIY